MTYNPELVGAEVRDELVAGMSVETSDDILSEFVTMVGSNKASETYVFAGDTPALEAFDDEIAIKSLSGSSQNLVNEEKGAGIEIKKSELEDDQTGIIRLRVGEFSLEQQDDRRRTCLRALNGNGSGYDGVAFFHDTHPARGSAPAQDNNLAGSGTTTAQVLDDLNLALARLLSLIDEGGRMVNKSLTKVGVIVHPDLRRPILEAIGSNLIGNTSNVSVQGLQWKIAFAAELNDRTDINVFNLSRRLKPILLQSRITGEIEEEYVKKSASYKWYLRVRNAAMLTRYQLGVRIVNAGA